MGNVESSLKVAKDAVELTRQVIYLGMGNYMNDPNDPRYVDRLRTGRAAGSAIGTGIEAVQRKIFGASMGIGRPMVGWLGEQIAKYGPETALLALRLSTLPEDLCSAMQGMYAKATGNGSMKSAVQLAEITRVAGDAIKLGVGNCTEHACLCYVLLRDDERAPRPLEVLLTHDHAFCCIGRRNKENPAEWGDETVIVDAYYGEYYLLEGGKLRERQQGVISSKGRIES